MSASGFRPVNLIEIDDVSPQPAEAVLALSANGTCLQRCTDFSVFIPHALALGEHKRTRYSASDSQGDDLFRVTKSVERGRIDPVKTEVRSGLNSGNRIQVALWAMLPSQPPPPMAHAPTPIGVMWTSLFPIDVFAFSVTFKLHSIQSALALYVNAYSVVS